MVEKLQKAGQIASERVFSAFGDFKLANLESPGLLVIPCYLSFTPSSLKLRRVPFGFFVPLTRTPTSQNRIV